MSGEPVIGWDVGGAHLKAARLDGEGRVERVVQVACPLWQGIVHLHAAVSVALEQLGSARLHGITMTGEMVDLFPDRRAGVAQLLAAMQSRLPGADLHCYAGADGFLSPERSAFRPAGIASANWLASAACVAAHRPAALFVDIGSTTTDLVPIVGGRVVARGRDDYERLVVGELLYTGVVRTPVMALAPAVPFAGDWVPVMAEFFATTADVYRLTELLPDGADLHPAADGGEKTVAGSARRLARMIGRDSGSAELEDWRRLAGWLGVMQLRRLEDACDRLRSLHHLPDGTPVVAAGVGRFLAQEVANSFGWDYIDFAELLPGDAATTARVADCAPAVSVAWLLQQQPP